MKTYILTERQIKEIVDQPMIKKGIALKISDENGEYYKSVLKEFVDEGEYNEWKDNLDDTMSVIGEMDIEDETSDVLKEEKSKIDPKEKAIELTTTFLKKKLPFIENIKIRNKDDIKKRSRIYINIVFDLNKIYDFTNTTPPESYIEFDFLRPTLLDKHSYLMTYVDSKYKQDFGFEYNNKIIDIMNSYYSRLPKYMLYTAFEGLTKDDILSDPDLFPRDPWFYESWRDDKDPIDFSIGEFEPIVNLEKLYSDGQ